MTARIAAARRVARLVAAIAVAASGGASVSAQAPAGVKITLDSVLRALHAGDSAVNLATADPLRHRALDSMTTVFQTLRATDLTVEDFAAAASARPPRMLDIFRWDREKVARAAQVALASSLAQLQRIALAAQTGLGPRILAQRGRADYDTYIGAMEALQLRATEYAQAASTTKLRRYESKFGPGSPTLNPIETTVNYVLHRIPNIGFGPSESGPGPLEFVATYSNSELTANGGVDNLRLTSAAHVGLRVYTFDTTAARNPIAQLAHPSSIAFGVSSFSPTDRPLDSPVRTGRRWGMFVDWGGLRVAAALSHDWRAMIGTRAQLIPHIF